MSVRLIAGRAGSGKTYHCQQAIWRELIRNLTDGPRLLFLVPEQATLQMERSLLGLLGGKNIRTLGRCDILSFRHLCNLIFAETTGPSPTILSSLGRQMALRLLISRHRKELREFARVAERGSFIGEISRGIVELMQEAVTVEQLEAAAEAAASAGDPAAARLHDAALLYRAYLDYLGDTRVDPEGVLDLARGRIASAGWLRGARIYIDGFAGFTMQQVRMLVAMAQMASHVDIAMLLDTSRSEPDGHAEFAEVDAALFGRTEQTWAGLERAFRDAGVGVEPPLILRTATRFRSSQALLRLERQMFVAPPVVRVSNRFSPSGHRAESSVRLLRYCDRRSEVSGTLREILDLVQRLENPLRFRDIAIIVRDLAPYHDLLSAGLRAHGIPFFIDRRRPIHHHPLVQLVRGLAALAARARFDESMIRILKSGLSGLNDNAADAVENYTLAFDLTYASAWDRRWNRPLPSMRGSTTADGGKPAAAYVQHVEAARARLRRGLNALWPDASNQAPSSAAVWVRRLYDTLQALQVPATLGEWRSAALARNELDEASEHEHVWSELVKMLDELDGAMGDEPMTGRQFREVIESALADFTLGLVPPTMDQVLVGSIERSRHPSIKAAFILGFCEGGFPARIEEDTIFGDAERAFLGRADTDLGRTREQHQLDERALAYIAMTRASHTLYVSYPEHDEAGRSLEPSSFLNNILGALPGAEIEQPPADGPGEIATAAELAARTAMGVANWARGRLDDEAAAPWLGLYDWSRRSAPPAVRATMSAALQALAPVKDAALRDDLRPLLWPPPYRTSVTQLETLAACPYQHFARYGLRLMDRDVLEVSQLHLGNLYHDALEQFVNELIEEGRHLAELDDASIIQRVESICDRILPVYAERLGLTDAQRDKVRWRARWELPHALRGQRATLARTHLRPEKTEQVFDADRELPALVLTTSTGEPVLLRGKIDRIDYVRTGEKQLVAVFDYKRAHLRRLSLDAVFHGLSLQLLAYLLVLRDAATASGGRVEPGGAFFLPLIGRHARVDHPADCDAEDFQPFKEFRPRGVIDFDWIDALDPTAAGGTSEAFAVARTKKDGSISRLNSSDAVPTGVMTQLLDHARTKLSELADAWLNGDIHVRPIRLGRQTPCSSCSYRSVCRFDFSTHTVRALTPMSRSAVIATLTGETDDAGPPREAFYE